MDRFNPDTSKPSTPVEEQVPHSGVHHNEKPDFPEQPDLDESTVDNLAEKGAQFNSVPQALVDRSIGEGLVLPSERAPAKDTIASSEVTKKQPMSRNKTIGISIVSGLVAVGVAVPTILGLTHSNATDKGTAPEKDTKGNSQVDGEKKPPVEAPKTFEQLVNDNKIEAGLSAEEYAKTLEDRLNNWALSGATNENFTSWVDSKSRTELEDQIAASQTAQYTEALFVPGYQNEQSLSNAATNLTTRNSAWLALWMRSYDFQGHKGTLEISSVIDKASVVSENPETGERVVKIEGHDVNNANDAKFNSEENRAKALSSNGDTWDHTLTLKTIDGKEYIANWEG